MSSEPGPRVEGSRILDGELVAPLLRYVCDTGAWQRFSVSSEHGAVQIADRTVGTVYPHYGIVKKTAEVCGNRPAR